MDILASDPYFAPLLAEDLSDLPRAYVIALEYDVLRDDGILYSRRLEAAGVESELRIIKGGWHGMMSRFNFVTIKKGDEVTDEMLRFVDEVV